MCVCVCVYLCVHLQNVYIRAYVCACDIVFITFMLNNTLLVFVVVVVVVCVFFFVSTDRLTMQFDLACHFDSFALYSNRGSCVPSQQINVKSH